jgi:hypothetical protein
MYSLTEQYFKTDIFQNIVKQYFDTVLNGILNYKEIIQVKGWYAPNGILIKDYYDMPYHIHILNGLIPALLIYEKFLLESAWIFTDKEEKDEEVEIYVKSFILGFTFHDADKLTQKDWKEAIQELDNLTEKLKITEFFPEFKKYKNDVYFLALSTENRSSIKANQYKISLDDKHLTEVLAKICHFADSISSIQELDGVETFYKALKKTVEALSNIVKLNISYIKILENPYTLLSQNLMHKAASILKENDRDIFYIMRDGFIFFGDDINENEKLLILRAFDAKNEDLDINKLVKIDAQKCDLSAISTIGIDKKMLNEIIDRRADNFLSLSPNGPDKIKFFDDFYKFNEQLCFKSGLPINPKIQNNKLYLNFTENAQETYSDFITIFSLTKTKWLNGKSNKTWKKDFEEWCDKNEDLPIEFETEFQVNEAETIPVKQFSDLKKYFAEITNSSSSLLKTYVAILKTIQITNSFEDTDEKEEYIENLYKEVANGYVNDENTENENSLLSEFFKKYFTHKGNKDFSVLNDYLPFVPKKKDMCAFTGQIATEPYVQTNAFGMNARGFSNRTVASLRNNESHISNLFAEENKLRISAFSRPKSNNVVYYDFFETTLDINSDIIHAVINSKDYSITDKSEIQFSKSIKFQYSLDNLEFVELSDNMKDMFYFVWKHLMFVKNLGIRSFITGIMSPYRSHKEVFLFENAPKFIKDLGWDRVRLNELEMVMEERDLLHSIGSYSKSMNTGLVLDYAESPNSIFKAFYQFSSKNDETQANMMASKINNFIIKYPYKFKGMTVIEKLVEIALQIDSSAKSGSEETWLIRSALDFLRKNVKEKLSKEDTIQQIAGNIYKTLRQGYTDTSIIEMFARLVFEELYEKEWKKSLPTLNRQKDWIYQFGFVFKQKSVLRMRLMKAEKIKKEIEQNQMPMNEESIISILKKDKLEKYADKYIQLILK